MVGRWCRHRPSHQSVSLRSRGFRPPTRVHVRLLGPCFKTGPSAALCQHLEDADPKTERPSFLGRPRGIDSRRRFLPRGQPMLTSSRRGTRPGGAARARVHPGRRWLPPQQFQALFNSLFKVLFIFPSRYLFAIGLSPVFSLRWDLPPT